MNTLVARVGDIARAMPSRIAIAVGDATLDYASLWRRANAFAAALLRQGIARGDRVALILPNGIEAVVATYGIWIAGGVVVPLNAQAKARDFTAWLEHADVAAILHDASNGDVVLAMQSLARAPRVLALDDHAGPPDAEAPPLELDAEAPALIIYTSGTTGRPKGVTLSHANLAANVQAIVAYLGLTADDSVVSVLPFYYSYGASVLHTHLAVGARVVLETNLVFPHLVVATLARERATGFSGVPSTYALLLGRVALSDHDLSSLRYLTQAGGAMAPALTRRLREALPDARLFVMYGQTEATARLTWLPPERLEDKLGSVGVPVDGVSIEVRDESGRRVEAGVVGEVHARGPGLMLGYWRDDEATRRVLRDGWLGTGDMGHVDAEGFLYLSGRRSDMIKTGAHRVHPNDVEEVIVEHPDVAEAAVVGVDDDLLGQVIKAFVVFHEGREPSLDRIKAHCRERLASYKIPKFIASVAALPKTASGKVRRAELAGNEPREVT